MTREEARHEIDSLDFYLQNHTDDYSEESHTAMVMAIKALEQTCPCDLCLYNPPSSGDGKPCSMCPACDGGNEE